MTKDVISMSISVLLLFRHYISHKITFGAPSSGGVLCSACGAFIMPPILEKFKGHIAFGLMFRLSVRPSVCPLENLLRYSFEILFMDSSSKNN